MVIAKIESGQFPTADDKKPRSRKKKRKEGWWSRFLKRLAETNQKEGVCRS